MVKNPPANAGDMGLISGLGRSPREGNGNPLSILAWRIPGTEEPGGEWGLLFVVMLGLLIVVASRACALQ